MGSVVVGFAHLVMGHGRGGGWTRRMLEDPQMSRMIVAELVPLCIDLCFEAIALL